LISKAHGFNQLLCTSFKSKMTYLNKHILIVGDMCLEYLKTKFYFCAYMGYDISVKVKRGN